MHTKTRRITVGHLSVEVAVIGKLGWIKIMSRRMRWTNISGD